MMASNLPAPPLVAAAAALEAPEAAMDAAPEAAIDMDMDIALVAAAEPDMDIGSAEPDIAPVMDIDPVAASTAEILTELVAAATVLVTVPEVTD